MYGQAIKKLEVSKKKSHNTSMMNDNKGLRGLGGTRIRVQYVDLVAACKECVDDVTNDNGVEFDTNLYYFIEGLIEDINDLRNGEECGVYPKTTEDAE